jgi:excisionase family DNA binding protein
LSKTEPELTAPQAAKRLGCSYRWVIELIRRGEIAATGTPSRRGREWRIEKTELARFKRSRSL